MIITVDRQNNGAADMTYITFSMILVTGQKIEVVAISIEAAKADVAAAYEKAEVLTYSVID